MSCSRCEDFEKAVLLLVALLVVLLIAIAAVMSHANTREHRLKVEAVKQGVATWDVDAEGNTTFRYLAPPERVHETKETKETKSAKTD